jgi:hypothetical protein
MGIESGSQRSLNRFKKGVSVEVNKRAIHTVRQFGIEPSLGFIMFEPYSTIADVRANLDFLKEMNLLTTPSVTAHLLYHKETLFQGTHDYATVFNDNHVQCKSFTGYEGTYAFKDERVVELSNLTARICQEALNRGGIDDCGVRNHSSPENKSLIDSFEQGLRWLEEGKEIKLWTEGPSY